MYFLKKSILVWALFFCGFNSFAQKEDPVIIINPHYSLQFPALDMADKFGYSSGLGFDFMKITSTNFVWGIGSQFIFGGDVKDSTILDHLMDDRGNIFGDNGEIAGITLFERGYHFRINGGYFYPLIKNNKGLIALGGLGFLQHKTRIQVETNNVANLEDDYLKMYDGLSNGLSTTLFLGWMHMSEKGKGHFYAGIDCTNGFTKNRRSYNYNVNGPDAKQRNDVLIGLKLGWVIPISKRSSQEFYYN